MLKIAYDHHIFSLQKYGGISRYLCELSDAIAKKSDFEAAIYAGFYQNKYLPNYHNVIIKGWQTFDLPIPGKVVKAINNKLNQIYFNIDRPDIIHETYYCRHSQAPSQSKTVLTVYDMIHEKFLDHPKNKNFLDTKAKSIQRADRIICISESTKNDLLELFDLNPNHISTVHLGFSGLNRAINTSNPIINFPYILYVGDRNGSYKNFERLLQSYSINKNIHDNFKLVCFGMAPLSLNEMEMVKNLCICTDDILYCSGDDSILANLYTYASAFIYPSLYEGFGIPPLEAMSFNCPVVCSDTSSIPEVVATAGEYFNPYEIESISIAIEKVLFSSDRSNELRAEGKERLKSFSWDKCARETAYVYQSLI
jgi:glycosyltransferase involved in cell wall biosynthesis